VTGFRDPFVLAFAGHRWAIVGAGLGTRAAALVYRCDDLRHWTYAGSLVAPTDPLAAAHAPAGLWECPQLFRVGRQWVLVVSLWTDRFAGPVGYLTGRLLAEPARDGTALRFVPASVGRVDWGGDFYAPAVLVEPDRVLMWGWSRESRPAAEISAAGWAGVLTLPRQLGAGPGGRLSITPARELDALRHGSPLADKQVALHAGEMVEVTALPPGADITLEVRAASGARLAVGLLESAAGRRLLVGIRPSTGEVFLARAGWPAVPARRDPVRGWFTPTDGVVRLRIIVDGPVLEIFAADEVALTERVYPRADDRPLLTVASGGGVARVGVTCWQLR
jgi:beta-fructofuranosidase